METVMTDDRHSTGLDGNYLGRVRRRLLAGCLCCITSPLLAQPEKPIPPRAREHLDAARAAAGNDLRAYLRLAGVIEPPRDGPAMTSTQLRALPTPDPGWAFDDFCFVGSKWVSAWVLRTSDGLLLIDAMDNDDDARHIVCAGLTTLGLDPRQIKLLLISHGHGDHYGGVAHIKATSQASVAMSEADWTMIETELEFDRKSWGRPPSRDRVLQDGESVRLGGTTVEVMLTPGHTPGTASLIFDVNDATGRHKALLWGGTAFNFGRRKDRIARLQSYIDATDRARDIVRARSIDVFLSNHDSYDGAVDKLLARRSGSSNPFVLGTPNVIRALTVMHECARATMEVWKS